MMTGGTFIMLNLRHDDIVYDPLPLYHTGGGMLGIGQVLMFGMSAVIRKKFSASNYWKDAVRYKATVGPRNAKIMSTCLFCLSWDFCLFYSYDLSWYWLQIRIANRVHLQLVILINTWLVGAYFFITNRKLA